MLMKSGILRLACGSRIQAPICLLRCTVRSLDNNEASTSSTTTSVENEKATARNRTHRVSRLPFGKIKPFLSIIHEVNRSALRLKSLDLVQLRFACFHTFSIFLVKLHRFICGIDTSVSTPLDLTPIFLRNWQYSLAQALNAKLMSISADDCLVNPIKIGADF